MERLCRCLKRVKRTEDLAVRKPAFPRVTESMVPSEYVMQSYFGFMIGDFYHFAPPPLNLPACLFLEASFNNIEMRLIKRIWKTQLSETSDSPPGISVSLDSKKPQRSHVSVGYENAETSKF